MFNELDQLIIHSLKAVQGVINNDKFKTNIYFTTYTHIWYHLGIVLNAMVTMF